MKKIKYLLLIIVVMICIFFYQDPYAMEESKILMAPTFENILGCDNLGRDIFSRLLLGSFYTLAIAFLSISLSVITGAIIGSLAGYFGKGIDVIIMSIVEVIMSIPGILIALGIIIILGTGFHSLIAAIFVIYIPRCVNVVRGLVKKEKNMEYVIAVKTYGVSDLRIIYRHILPNILGYLGLGIQPPYPTWGNMLNQSQSYFLSAPWFTIAPGLAIIFTIYQIKKLEKRGRKY